MSDEVEPRGKNLVPIDVKRIMRATSKIIEDLEGVGLVIPKGQRGNVRRKISNLILGCVTEEVIETRQMCID